MMPRYYAKKRPPPTYTLEDIAKAVDSVKNNGVPYRTAALAFGVPRTVLYNRINGRKTPLDQIGQGRRLVFSAEAEKEIIERFSKHRSEGHACTKKEFLDLVAKYIEEHKLKNPFINNRPGEEWYRRFLKRYPTLIIDKSNNFLQQYQSFTDANKRLYNAEQDHDVYANESCNIGSIIQWPPPPPPSPSPVEENEVLIKDEPTDDGGSGCNGDVEIKVEDLDVSNWTKAVFEITEFDDSGTKVSEVMAMLPQQRNT